MAQEKLQTYRAKRDFAKTSEPAGDAPAPASNRLRFVIQKHAATRLHYDLRLELDGVFKSWAVTRGPSLDPHDKRLAVEVEDHPLDYGDFEGTIPKGEYGGGTVLLWDRGYWEPQGMTVEAGLESGDLKFTLEGERLHGSWVLVRIKNDRWAGKSGAKRTNWLLIKHKDAFAKPGEGESAIADESSVASGRDMAAIAAGDRGRAEAVHDGFRRVARCGVGHQSWHRRRGPGCSAEEARHPETRYCARCRRRRARFPAAATGHAGRAAAGSRGLGA